MGVLTIILVGISLSMDAFSLSLAYGTLGMNFKDKCILSCVVGFFHFFMPLFGQFIGRFIIEYIIIDPKLITMLILSFIGVNMIISSFKDEEVKNMKFYEYFLFGLAVSVDSFSVGIALRSGFVGPILFSVFSFLFTLLGLFLGGKIKRVFGNLSTIIGGIILISIGIYFAN